MIRIVLLIILLTFNLAASCRYMLDLSIDPDQKKIEGMSAVKTDKPLTITLPESVTPTDALTPKMLALKAGEELTFSFKTSAKHAFSKDNIILGGSWYPIPSTNCAYDVKLSLPFGYLAVMESDSLKHTESDKGIIVESLFEKPLERLHMAASRQWKPVSLDHNGTLITAYFTENNAELAQTYLKKSVEYLRLYESILGNFPYDRFSLVETVQPFGHAMPSMTWLGSHVIRLPFIPETSLPHEIVHQWLGAGVYMDSESGNWSEGLATYLADHKMALQKGEGARYRKTRINHYEAYVEQNASFSLESFRFRSDKAQQSVGYGKGSLFWHMLEHKIGTDSFQKGLQTFVESHLFKNASYEELKTALKTHTSVPVDLFFNQWLESTDNPMLFVSNPKVALENHDYSLSFRLHQEASKAYKLQVPITVHTTQGDISHTVALEDNQSDVAFTSSYRPTGISIDPNYDLMRTLGLLEKESTISRFLGDPQKICVVTDSERKLFASLLKLIGCQSVITPEPSQLERLKTHTFVLLGKENPLIGKLAPITDESALFSLSVNPHPYLDGKVYAVLHMKSVKDSRMWYRARHFGKYREVSFLENGSAKSVMDETSNGLYYALGGDKEYFHRESGKYSPSILPFLNDAKIVYVGETHDQMPHHLIQLDVIKQLHDSGRKVAIGMEMFHTPYQDYIDAYLKGAISTEHFLSKTRYFEIWAFDYKLYAPIIEYAKTNRIPVIALNVGHEYHRGITENGIFGLKEEAFASLPNQFDLRNKDFRERLHSVYALHARKSSRTFQHFLQAQTLWDEGMAENAAAFSRKNPDHTLVVIAGSGHVGYKNAIPERLYARIKEPYSIIIPDGRNAYKDADITIDAPFLSVPLTPKLGAFLKTADNKLVITGFTDGSAAKKAGAQEGDEIVSLNGKNVTTLFDLKSLLYTESKVKEMILQVARKDRKMDLTLEYDAS